MARKILVVDDAATLRLLIRRALQGVPAEDLGLEALAGMPEIERMLAALELAGGAGADEEAKPLEPSGPRRRRSSPT